MFNAQKTDSNGLNDLNVLNDWNVKEPLE